MTPRQDPCQESSSVRPIRTAVRGRTPSPNPSYGQPKKSQCVRTGGCHAGTNPLMRHGRCLRPCFCGTLRGHDAPIRPNGEKTIPAGSAPVRGKTKQAEQPGEFARPMLAGDALYVHVATQFAMHEANVRDWRSPAIKSQSATLATPGAQHGDPDDIVLQTPPAGTARAVALADRAKQSGVSPGMNCDQEYGKAVSQSKFPVTC